MNKAEKKFRLYAILVIFILLTVLLSVINGMNFTMAARDADEVTRFIAEHGGTLDHSANVPAGMPAESRGKNFSMGPMGPDSPEMNDSIRYFTIAFPQTEGKVVTVAFHISAVSESNAVEWAESLLKGETGWTRGTYRYRVYNNHETTFVTVIDQGRELLPSYRILIISAVGEVLCLLIGWFLLLIIGRKIYAPIEEADRKQTNFINNANKEFRIPLTIIGGNNEIAERQHGPDDQTRSTRRQLAKLNELVDKLGTIGVYGTTDTDTSEIPLSEYINAALDAKEEEFASRGISLTSDIAPDITVKADPDAVKRMIDEIMQNALKFAITRANVTLKRENGYILLETANDAELSDGSADNAFDRFTVLDNAKDKENCAGLGLAFVKETVKAHNWRASANVSGGTFIMRITF